MKLFAFFLTIAASVVTVPGEGMSDKNILQGTWKVIAVKYDDPEIVKSLSKNVLEIKGDRYWWSSEDLPEGNGRFTLREDARPKQFDFYCEQSVDPKVPKEAIYKIEGNRLTLCWHAFAFKPVRPTDFVIRDPKERMLFVLEKVKK